MTYRDVDAASAAAAAASAAAGCGPCAPYHGLWPWLRLLGLAATPHRHAAFYDAWLVPPADAGADGGATRVLVCGAADEVMVTIVLDAYDRTGRSAAVTVVDRCPTPIALCRAYASEADLDIDAAVTDLFSYEPGLPFDVLCTHSLLSILAAEERGDAVARWRSWLKPGGRVVTVARVADRPAPLPDPGAFAAVVREQAARMLAPMGVDPDELAEAALRYVEATVVHPFGSCDEVVALFEGADLELEHLEVVAIDGPVGARAAHPGTAQPSRYVEVVAHR